MKNIINKENFIENLENILNELELFKRYEDEKDIIDSININILSNISHMLEDIEFDNNTTMSLIQYPDKLEIKICLTKENYSGDDYFRDLKEAYKNIFEEVKEYYNEFNYNNSDVRYLTIELDIQNMNGEKVLEKYED